jgi:protein-S-isoprenylcysteine O-methyltransferase Ste14
MLRHTIETIVAAIVVPGAVDGFIPYLILARTGERWAARIGIVEVLAILLAVLGVAAMMWVATAFVRRGKGTPIPFDPPMEFVASGLYRHVRNPMYVGALSVLVGEAFLFRSWWILLYGACLWVALHTFVVLIEEPQLERRFGEAYRRYKASTPRWVPRRCPVVR